MQVVFLPALAMVLASHGRARRLMRRLARARPLPSLPPGRSAQIEAFFGIAASELAWLAAVADGLTPQNAWVRAEPVVVHVDIASLRLLAVGADIGLAEAEEAELFASIAEWCTAAGIEARRPGAFRWYLALPADWPLPEGDPPDRWLGRVLDRSWRAPSGVWGRLLAEIEMLLAGHPVNQRRRHRGSSPVTGVWVWGGRRPEALPALRARGAEVAVSGDPLVRSCAAHRGMELRPPASAGSSDPVALLDLSHADLASPPPLPVPAEWWFACGRRFAVGRLDALRFWRRSPGSADTLPPSADFAIAASAARA